jgi:zona occludens toxin
MITLITGTPGAGKSLYTVAELLRKQYAGRRLLVSGIPDLALDHEPITDEQAASWHKIVRPEDVLVVDEAQRLWRPRGSGACTPEGVAAMEIHRSTYSVDVVLITQHPGLVDANIRKLVGRHIHLRNVWGMKRALVYEWGEATDPNRIKSAQVKPWAYPKDAFHLYRSAQVHTKRGQRPPLILWLTAAFMVSVPVSGWYAYRYFAEKSSLQPLPVADAPARPSAQAPGAPAHLSSVVDIGLEAFVQRLPDMPATAPIYDNVRRVVEAPRITGCMSSASSCTCYTQQRTVAEVSPEFCARWLAGERPFDPFAENQPAAPHSPPAQAAPPSREGGGVSLTS